MTTTVTTALTAGNRSVDIEGATLVYRRLGDSETGAPPLLCLQHFRGNLDNWDPAMVDRLATDREVMLLANRGVGASTGVVPDNVEDMARDVLRFIDALGQAQLEAITRPGSPTPCSSPATCRTPSSASTRTPATGSSTSTRSSSPTTSARSSTAADAGNDADPAPSPRSRTPGTRP
jgi:hypothetical protein